MTTDKDSTTGKNPSSWTSLTASEGLKINRKPATPRRSPAGGSGGESRRTTPGRSGDGDFFHVVHPFHPLAGQELERASGPPQESYRRVFFHTADGRLSSIPLTFTDLVELDPFVAVSAGRALLGGTER